MYERRGLRTGSETPRLNSFALVAWWFFLSTQRASRPCGAMSEQLLLKPYDNALNYSHSMVAGGFEVMSYATRLMPGTSATMRPEMRASTS